MRNLPSPLSYTRFPIELFERVCMLFMFDKQISILYVYKLNLPLGVKIVLLLCRRYIGIFSFVRDQVFAPFAQRAYSDPVEKWKLVVAALTHFQMCDIY